MAIFLPVEIWCHKKKTCNGSTEAPNDTGTRLCTYRELLTQERLQSDRKSNQEREKWWTLCPISWIVILSKSYNKSGGKPGNEIRSPDSVQCSTTRLSFFLLLLVLNHIKGHAMIPYRGGMHHEHLYAKQMQEQLQKPQQLQGSPNEKALPCDLDKTLASTELEHWSSWHPYLCLNGASAAQWILRHEELWLA